MTFPKLSDILLYRWGLTKKLLILIGALCAIIGFMIGYALGNMG